MKTVSLKREVFTTSREAEYFSESELVTQTGHPKEDWFPRVIVKELVDNPLDACEQAGVAPDIRITLDEGGSLTISDNGPGIPPDVVEKILDYSTRTSDKQAYVSPTRGAQGNALKTILAIPFVLNGGEPTTIVINALGVNHTITVDMDHIARRPAIDHQTEFVKTEGTTIRLCSCLKTREDDEGDEDRQKDLLELVRDYALFNPHATFVLDESGTTHRFEATDPGWHKWSPSSPTSPHWYSPERLENLIASYVAAERAGAAPRTVRQFVAEFRGLSATAKQKTVSAAAGLERAHLHDLVIHGQLDKVAIRRLLLAMQGASKRVKPEQLGILGEAHFRARLVKNRGSDRTEEASLNGSDDQGESLQNWDYRRTWGYRSFGEIKDGLPMLVEVGFCLTQDPGLQGVHFGMNWSPASDNALEKDDFDGNQGFQAFLADNYISVGTDPITMVVHLICPRFTFLDRGKGTVSLSNFSDLIVKAVKETTKRWSRIKKQEERDQQAAARSRERYIHGRSRMSIKDAAYEVMAEAYQDAAGSRGLATARQIYYAARPKILELTGDTSLSGPYFQKLLPDYQREHPQETADWDVIYDARGHFAEPHTGAAFGLGTLGVREYLQGVNQPADQKIEAQIGSRFPTHGPQNRYGAVLYIEKEGFLPLLEQAQIAERYDIAIMSSKGMGSTAARDLIGQLDQQGAKILVVHDFDNSGFSILGTLIRDTDRYRHATQVEVNDVGLRLEDVEEWGLESERVTFKGTAETLRENGATEEEIEFLMGDERVELNAFTSDNFISWLESKLEDAGIQKVIPDSATLEIAWRRAAAIAEYCTILKAALPEVEERVAHLRVPQNLPRKIQDKLVKQPCISWDEAINLFLPGPPTSRRRARSGTTSELSGGTGHE